MELSDQTGSDVAIEDVRWVVTVPAIWKQPAKQFMREAAYQVKDFLCQSLYLFMINIAGVRDMPFMYNISHCHSETFCVVIVL
jgi:hypothetical protein